MTNIIITMVKDAEDHQIFADHSTEISWEEFCDQMTHEVLENKLDAPMIIPASFKTEDFDAVSYDETIARRCTANMIAQYMLVIDVDGEMSITKAQGLFRAYNYLLVTSHSHGKATKSGDCFRIFIPFNSPCPVDEYKARGTAMMKWVNQNDTHKNCDASTKACTRGFFMPSAPQERIHLAQKIVNKGIDLDWTKFPKPKPIVYKKPKVVRSNDIKSKIIEQLQKIYLGQHHEWFKVATAMKTEGFDFHEFCEVSIGGMMNSKTQSDCEKMWNSVNEGRVNMGYLINLIKNNSGAVK